MPQKVEKKTRNPEATKASLIHAGETLFAQRGFSGTTVEALANKANTNKALVSYYFDSKEGLYDEVIRSIVADVVGEVLAAARETGDPVEDFRLYVSALARALGSRRTFPAILLREYVDGEMQARDTPFVEVLQLFRLTKQRYEAGKRAKLFRNIDPHQLHLSIIGPLVLFIIAEPARRRAKKSLSSEVSDPALEEFARHHQRMILRALLPKRALDK